MSIATQEDLEAILQINFDLDNDPKVAAIIAAAQSTIEGYVGCPLDAASAVVSYHTGLWRAAIQLPRWPVTSVTSVVKDGTTLTEDVDFVVWARGTIEAASGVWVSSPKGIVITADYGFPDADAAPPALRQLVAKVASRMWQAGVGFAENSGAAGVKQETLGGYSVTFTDEALDVAKTLSLSEEEKSIARRFARRSMGGVWT